MYKSKLQELCQKQAWELPKYEVSKHGLDHHPLFKATVSVNGSTFESPEFCRTSKEAQNDAARNAFLHFTAPVPGSLNTTLGSGGSVSNNTLLKSPDNGRAKDMHHLYKNMLQNFTQKKELHLPVYCCECEGPPHARRFKCKVIVDGETFESSESFSTIKDAEHAAAKVALASFSLHGLEEEDSGFYKNLLQELAQKRACQMPVYTTTMSGEAHAPSFVSSVFVDGESFTGEHVRTKRQAEISAAKVAFTILNGSRQDQNSTASTPANQETGTPEPSGLHLTVDSEPQENARPQVNLLHNCSLTSSEPAVMFRDNYVFDSRRLHSFPQPVMEDSSLMGVLCSPPMELEPPPEVNQYSACPAPDSSVTTNSSNEPPTESRMSRNRVIVHSRLSNMKHPPARCIMMAPENSSCNFQALKIIHGYCPVRHKTALFSC